MKTAAKTAVETVADAIAALAREHKVSVLAVVEEECDGQRWQVSVYAGRPLDRVVLAAQLYGAERERHEHLLADVILQARLEERSHAAERAVRAQEER